MLTGFWAEVAMALTQTTMSEVTAAGNQRVLMWGILCKHARLMPPVPPGFARNFERCPGTNDTIDDGFVSVFPFAGAPGRWDDVPLIQREIQ